MKATGRVKSPISGDDVRLTKGARVDITIAAKEPQNTNSRAVI
jgi:hypothetical protein